jgi:hypothetical protein
MTREEHLAWCRARALEYLPDTSRALASIMSDLLKHPETRPSRSQIREASFLAAIDDAAGLRDWIEDYQ